MLVKLSNYSGLSHLHEDMSTLEDMSNFWNDIHEPNDKNRSVR